VLHAAATAWLQVKPDSSVAQRSAASGHLVLTMLKEEPGQAAVDVTYLRQAQHHAHSYVCMRVEALHGELLLGSRSPAGLQCAALSHTLERSGPLALSGQPSMQSCAFWCRDGECAGVLSFCVLSAHAACMSVACRPGDKPSKAAALQPAGKAALSQRPQHLKQQVRQLFIAVSAIPAGALVE
jgi:hypothetical protein